MFNILGPLSNPASAQGRVLGVFDPALLELIPQVLLATGVQRAFVLRSQDGMDELSLNAPSDIVQVAEGGLKRLSLDPQNLGFRPCHPEELAGGTAEDNARKILFILNGERGPARDITVLNAAAAILTAGLARDFAEAIVQAERAIDSRRAYDKLQALKRISNEAAG
jgi:anthranilate phosphoribosyltransferase